MWLVTTSDVVPYEILWKMMHKRWDIEENVFHQLKTYYYAKHCYCHAGVEAVFLLTLVAFNIRELYLYRRIHWFKGSGVTRKSVTRIFRDDLLVENYCSLAVSGRRVKGINSIRQPIKPTGIFYAFLSKAYDHDGNCY